MGRVGIVSEQGGRHELGAEFAKHLNDRFFNGGKLHRLPGRNLLLH
jgi:hypothetical protein